MRHHSVIPSLTLFMVICLQCVAYNLIAQTNSDPANLHQFVVETGNTHDNMVISDGTYLYGTRYDGGLNGNGWIYRVKLNGTDYEVIHYFEDNLDGAKPTGNLVISGSTLYGITNFGGTQNVGVVFKVDTDGQKYSKLLDFTPSFGAIPYGSVSIYQDYLYVVARQGDTVFRIKTDGSDFKNLINFNGSNGQNPTGQLVILNDTIYGVTARGGENDLGVIYRVKTDGTEFKRLFDFNNTSGGNAWGGLLLHNSVLYGTTTQGGPNSVGTLFSIDYSGTDFQIHHNFDGSAYYPSGSLIISGSDLVGMSANGGWGGNGTIYKFNLANNLFSVLYNFEPINTVFPNGRNPWGTLNEIDNKLFAHIPGGQFGYGVIFSIANDGSEFTKISEFQSTNNGYNPKGELIFDDVYAYGVTQDGGEFNRGVIYRIDTVTLAYNVIFNFNGDNGAHPETSLVLMNNILWGTTLMGGQENSGVLFKLDKLGDNYSIIRSFYGESGSFPSGKIIFDDNTIYGNLQAGGAENKGAIFSFDIETETYDIVIDFSTTEVLNPRGNLVKLQDRLYGMCLGGVGDGIIFSVKTDGTLFQKLLNVESTLGGRYGNYITNIGDTLFISTRQGGQSDLGVIFRMTTDGQNFKKLIDFEYSIGAVPVGPIIVIDGDLYGMTELGGPNDSGTAFKINSDGTGFEYLFEIRNDSESGKMKLNKKTTSSGTTITEGYLSLLSNSIYGTLNSVQGEIRNGRIIRYKITKDNIITSTQLNESLSLYPNPSNGLINIEGRNKTVSRVLNANGVPVLFYRIGSNAIDIGHLPEGLYIIMVDSKYVRVIKN